MIEKVIQGDNLEVLKTYPDNYFDSVITDPPYGINFMGKKWDYDVPSVETWKEVLRVLKPGGHILVACGTRTQHRMAVNIEDAGFEIRDIVAWLYGSGFPKSMDISKAIDKHLGAEREVVGKSDNARPNSKKENNLYQAGTVGKDFDITAPTTDLAKQYEGWGTALKPAMELWTLARKPLIGTVAENVIEYGTGGINIDECRVPSDEADIDNLYRKPTKNNSDREIFQKNTSKIIGTMDESYKKGRFPANVIHDGSDEVVSLFPESKSGEYKGEGTKSGGIWSKSTGQPAGREYGDEGSAARFFYTAKASQSERNWGLNNFNDEIITDGRNKSIDNPFNRGETKRKNIHPTVKPIDLMRYLVKMITPKNGIVLDLYAGSGSTLIACKLEKFQYVGIELEPDYVEIINARLKAWRVQYDIFDFID